MKRGGIYYFDSYGIEPPNEVKKLMKRIRSQGNDLVYNNEIELDGTYMSPIVGNVAGENMIKVNGGNKLEEDDIIEMTGGGKKKKLKVKSVNGDGIIILDGNVLKDKDMKMMRKGYKEFYNPRRFQYKNSECGMFSMWFIIQFLNDKDYGQIITSKIDDEYVFRKRNEYYRPNMKKIKKGTSFLGFF
jgi:hypothetical protein